MTPDNLINFDRHLLSPPLGPPLIHRSRAALIPDRFLVKAYRREVSVTRKHLQEARAARDTAYLTYVKFRPSEEDYESPWFLRYLELRGAVDVWQERLVVLVGVWSRARRAVRR